MRESVQFQLTEGTKLVLSQLDDVSDISATIRVAGHCVGLATQKDIPAGIVLPAGLEWNTESVKVQDIKADSEATESMNLIALRYQGVVCISASDIDAVIRDVTESEMIKLNDKFIGEESVGDIITTPSAEDACEVELFTADRAQDGKKGLSFDAVKGKGRLVMIKFDSLAYCSLGDSKAQVLELIAISLRRVLEASFSVSDEGRVSITHHRVLGGGLAVTLVSAVGEDEKSSESTVRRRAIHDGLMLPKDRPMFRKSCRSFAATSALSDGGWPGRLTNVHMGIKSHKLGDEGVTVHMMHGTYLYCHYMQDKFNDSGWGCAYRSLQTILSWCAFERYIELEYGKLPTHRQIQQALADVGDKEASFVGSKEWIGANEVCYALEKLTGVSSKILHVSSGAEMESKGRELAQHFDRHGSPVMVGGGVLAWTILGVARDSRTGETKFLILDPHYEGRDDLKVIQNKGWIAWKGGDAFVQNAFYNLCMPQRPSTV
ncbi:Peptidase C78 [Gracilaria domingensis]|nr:Peptidase C78 [Gracilaria domingensis]